MKKRIFIYYGIIVFILLCIILGIFFAFYRNNTDDKLLTGKVEEEIDYLEDKMIDMMNKLNHISFSNYVLIEEKVESSSKSSNSEADSSENESSSSSENSSNLEESTEYELENDGILVSTNQEIDWDYIKLAAETLYSTWPTVVVDLNELNVNNEDILNFSKVLDQVTLSVKQEDKTTTLNNLASLYAFLPNYRSQISENNQSINIDYTINCLLNSYALVEQDKWEEVKNQILNAINYFSDLMNNIQSNGQSQNYISKIYVLLNELNNTVDLKDKELYYIKYRNVMEELTDVL